MIYRSHILKLILILLLISCGDDPAVSDPQESEHAKVLSEIEQVATQIYTYVADASADHLNQCGAIPIGAKPCGGPWAYLVFSDVKVDKNTLQTLVETYTELDSERNRILGRASDCAYVGPPELTLKNGACRGEGFSVWNPGDILDFNDIETN